MSRERSCSVRGCREHPAKKGHLFCTAHWGEVPEDIQERINWAKAEGTTSDLFAAINAALTQLL